MQAQDSIAQSRPEAAQARGRALLNLRVQDAEGGLLGRTLLTLVSQQGDRHAQVIYYTPTELIAGISLHVDAMQWLK